MASAWTNSKDKKHGANKSSSSIGSGFDKSHSRVNSLDKDADNNDNSVSDNNWNRPRPTRNSSGKFSSKSSDWADSWKPQSIPSFAQADDYSSSTAKSTSAKKSQRSTAYTSPLAFGSDRASSTWSGRGKRHTQTQETFGKSKPLPTVLPLTEENVQLLQSSYLEDESPFGDHNLQNISSGVGNLLESGFSGQGTGLVADTGSDARFSDPQAALFAHMRNLKSRAPDKKSTGRKKYKDHSASDEHPLNLPPDQLKRLSQQRMAAHYENDRRSSSSMDVDMSDNMSSTNGHAQGPADGDSNQTSSQPPTPGTEAPGAFPTEQTNGDTGADVDPREDTKSPPPPQHRINVQPKTDPEAAKAAGNKFFKAKDYARAVAEYTKAVDADPSNSTYLSNRAAAYMSDNKFQNALQDCLQANTLDPNNEKVLHRLARIYTSLGRPEDALDVYSRIPNASATDTSAARRAKQSIEMAEKQLSLPDGDGKQALWNIDQAKQTLGYGAPMPRTWQVMRAKANLKIGSANALGEVQSIAQALMRDNSMDAEAMTLAGKAFYLKDEKGVGKTDYQRAEECFRRALSFDPDAAEARDALRIMKRLERAKNEANDLYKRAKWQEAVDAYGECLSIDPANKITNAKILGNRALAQLKTEHYEEAKADCDAALKLDPTYMKAKKTRAKIVGEQGDWEQAVQDLKALAEENQGDADIAKELRNAELELKKSKRKDWYKILGVAKDASDKDIERAYKKKAAVLHPDKTQGDKEKEAMFKDCLEAKETLLDPQKRHMYDSGADLMEPGMAGHPFGGGFGGMGGMGGMGGGVQIDPEMLFNMMGGMGGAQGGRGGAGGFPGGFSFSTGGPQMGGQRGGFPF